MRQGAVRLVVLLLSYCTYIVGRVVCVTRCFQVPIHHPLVFLGDTLDVEVFRGPWELRQMLP